MDVPSSTNFKGGILSLIPIKRLGIGLKEWKSQNKSIKEDHLLKQPTGQIPPMMDIPGTKRE